MLVQAIVRDGEKVIISDVRDEETGQSVSLNVAQYIDYDLGLDNLTFSNPIYNRILAEAKEQSQNSDFRAEEYFIHHPDIEIAQLAAELCAEQFKLSESMQLKKNENRLRVSVINLILDFRKDFIEHHLKELQARLPLETEPERILELMNDINRMSEVRNALAKKLGINIVV